MGGEFQKGKGERREERVAEERYAFLIGRVVFLITIFGAFEHAPGCKVGRYGMPLRSPKVAYQINSKWRRNL